MNYEDRTLTCQDCGQPFVFSADDQSYHATKGFPNERLKRADDESFVNTLANAFRFPVEEKQLLLETNDISDRFEVLAGLLDGWLQSSDGGRVPGNRTLH